MAARAAVLRGYGNIDACSVRLRTAVRNRFAAEKNRLDMIGEKVRKSSPGYILSSGYSIAYGAHGRLGSVNDVAAGDSVKVLLRDGTLDCIVNNIRFELFNYFCFLYFSVDKALTLMYNDKLYQNGYLYLFRVKIFDFGLKKHRTFFPVLCIFTRLTI